MKAITDLLTSLGLIRPPLTLEQRCGILALKIRSRQMWDLHQETGYGAPNFLREYWG